MDIGSLYDWVLTRANKDKWGGILTPDMFNLALEVIDLEFLKLKFGMPEEYQPGMPMPRQSWEITRKIKDDLRVFLVVMGSDPKTSYLAIDKLGQALFPTNCMHVSSMRFNQYYNTDCNVIEKDVVLVEELTDGEWGPRLSDAITKPTKRHPVFTSRNNYLQFNPVDLKWAEMSYLRLPVPAFYDYNIVDLAPEYLPSGSFHDGSNLTIGTPSGSRDLEWPDMMHIDISNLLFQFMAVKQKDSQLYQESERRKHQGV